MQTLLSWIRGNRVLRIARFRLHTRLGQYPRLLFPLYAALGLHRDFIVTGSSRLLIEGFPRSAATFCSYAFVQAQAGPVDIGFHLHVPAHVMRAVRLGVPTLVLIRDPREAVASAVLREPAIPLGEFLRRYLSFYETLEPYRAHFVTADFADAVSDFGRVTRAINGKYGTSFNAFDHSDANLEAVYASLDERHRQVGGGAMTSYRPDVAKEVAKRHVDFSADQALLERCQVVYRRWTTV